MEIHPSKGQWHGFDGRVAAYHSISKPSFVLFSFQFLGIGALIRVGWWLYDKVEWISRSQIGICFNETVRIDQQCNTFACRQPKVMIAARTYLQVFLPIAGIQNFLTFGTFDCDVSHYGQNWLGLLPREDLLCQRNSFFDHEVPPIHSPMRKVLLRSSVPQMAQSPQLSLLCQEIYLPHRDRWLL